MAEQKDWEEISSEGMRGLQEGILRQSSRNHLQCGMFVSVEVGEGTTGPLPKGQTIKALRDLRGVVQTEDSKSSILWSKMLGIEPQKTCSDRGLSALWK